jgi:hypothetical protein
VFSISHDRPVSGIEAAPDQSEIALVVIEETLVTEPGVIGVRLVELVVMGARLAFNRDHESIQRGFALISLRSTV